MGKRYVNKAAIAKYMEQHDRCELCGATKELECHHIIPMAASNYGINLDIDDNYICVCYKCHSLLTPRKLLAKYGIEKRRFDGSVANRIAYEFYIALGKQIEKDPMSGFADVCDVFDSVMNNYGAMKGAKHGTNAI